MNKMKTNKYTSLHQAKVFLRENWGNTDSICPCCRQIVSKRKRKLNAGMAITLIRLSYLLDFIHVKNYLRANKFSNSHDWTQLKYWGLLEEKLSENYPDDKCSGQWRITRKGREFVLDNITVPKYVYTFNSRYWGSDGDPITIKDALSDKFNYGELMQITVAQLNLNI